MKIREAYKAYGNKKSLDKFCEGVAKRHGITVVPAGVVDEENPSDNYLTIYFEYKGNDDGAANFIRAIDEVSRKLATRGLALSHECNGDGSIGIIQSYRVVQG